MSAIGKSGRDADLGKSTLLTHRVHEPMSAIRWRGNNGQPSCLMNAVIMSTRPSRDSVYGCKTSFCARQFSSSPTHSTFSDGHASA
jgi:hypothetical protein